MKKIKTKYNFKTANSINFFRSLSNSLVYVFLPLYYFHLGINLVNIGTIIAISVIATNLTKLYAGSLADSFNRKKIMLTGAAIMTLTNFSLLFFNSELYFILRGILFGIAFALFIPAYSSYVWDISEKRKLSTHNAIRSIYRYLGIILAPPIGGLLIYFYGFNALFIASVIAGIGVLLLINSLNDFKHENKLPVFSKIIETYRSIAITEGFAILSIVHLIKATFDLIWYTFILIYLKNVIGYDFWQAGLVITGSYLMLMPFQMPLGRFSDKFHSKWLIIPGFIVLGISMKLFFMFDHFSSYVVSAGGVAISLLAIGRPIYVRLAEMTPDSKHGQALALFEAISWGFAAILLFYIGELAEKTSILEVMNNSATFALGTGLILVIFHRKIRWKYGNHLKRHHFMKLYTPIDRFVDSFPNLSRGFK